MASMRQLASRAMSCALRRTLSTIDVCYGSRNSLIRVRLQEQEHRSFSHRFQRSSFSTAPHRRISDLKTMVKPFMLKCHPDVMTDPEAKRINLGAIQNLNQYMDTLQSIGKGQYRQPQDDYVRVDFVVSKLEKRIVSRKRNEEIIALSHRSVQLRLPSRSFCQEIASCEVSKLSTYKHELFEHSRYEIAKLLKVAGLDIPEGFQGHRPEATTAHKIDRRTSFEQARERFVRGIKWDVVNKLYEEMKRDEEADIATKGIYQKQKLKNQLVAKILANVRLKEEISFVEQVVCFRRLSLIFNDHFDALQMEEYGGIWENTMLLLTGARPYNTSGSHLRKRKRKNLMTGFAFTLHSDNTITIEMPIDFQDDEFLQELKLNLPDFYEVLYKDGFDEIWPEPELYMYEKE